VAVSTLDYGGFAAMLLAAADKVRVNRAHLSELDSATGDGDHGTAVSKVANAIAATIEKAEGNDLKKLLKDIAWEVMGTDAGSTSPLYGSLFLGMSETTPDETPIDCPALAAMFESGLSKLRKNTKAQPGDKTMIDALVPAVQTIRQAADQGKEPAAALAAGAQAAAQGAEATRQMKAAFGRAKNIGDRSIGHADPGATSMSMFFMGLSEELNNG